MTARGLPAASLVRYTVKRLEMIADRSEPASLLGLFAEGIPRDVDGA